MAGSGGHTSRDRTRQYSVPITAQIFDGPRRDQRKPCLIMPKVIKYEQELRSVNHLLHHPRNCRKAPTSGTITGSWS
ncbi:protein of unknown function [Rhodovastum atsumiense]|nr:protein of unknown function [Rhodovastum atsumiense]